MYKISELKNLLYFDIETLPESPWGEISEGKKKLWLEKYHYKFVEQEMEHRKKSFAIAAQLSRVGQKEPSELYRNDPTFEEIYNKYSPLIAEFGRVWCISVGALDMKNVPQVDTLQDDDEKKLLEDFLKMLTEYEVYNLAGFNINEFDIPYILKRMWVHGLVENYPRQLQLKDAKPWTVKHVDFMNDWSSTMRERQSLALVCETLGVPSPKTKFNNDEFATLMLQGKISKQDGIDYCERDVVALMKCMLKVAAIDCNYAGNEAAKKTWSKK